jgi:anaerobic selenocysteine-containing dehydrogenase
MSLVLGTCHHDCPDSCGWVATVEDGRAVKLRGNPDHPYSQGELCPKVNRFLDRVYSPERVLHPLRRTGPKGSGRFEECSWDEATGLVASRIGEVIDRHGGEAILPWYSAGTQGLINLSSLDRRFFNALGATRLTGSLCGATAGAGTASTYGSGRAADPTSIRYAKLAVLWGTNTRLTNRHLWPFVEEARAAGATVVVVDPMKTITAESADWFIQPRPGTDVALMLGMMHVLIRDDLLDHAYIESYSTGFDRLAEHVRDWTPQRASVECGVPADEIERFATTYGRVRPAFIRTLVGAEHHAGGAMFFRALSCLPVLTGAWRERGGGYARSVGTWASINVDASVFDPAVPGTPTRGISMNHLGRALTDPSLDPPIHGLFVWNGNPLVSVPNAADIRRGLEREDLFTVVSEQFLTDTARYADVVFPATTQLEQLDLVESWGHLNLGWNEPAIEPLGEAVPNTELWRRLAAAFGIEDPLFELDDIQLIKSALIDVDLDQLRTRGFVRLDVPDELLPYADGGFATPDGRAALWSDDLELSGHGGLPDLRDSSTNGYPLALMTPKIHTRFLNTSYSHLPKHGRAEGGPYVELSAADADSRSLNDGDKARVFNDAGELELVVRIGDRVPPGVASVPYGWWSGDHLDGHTANHLTTDAETDWGGGVAFWDTRVEVVALG